MTIPGAARTLLVLGRLVALAAAVFAVVVMAGQGYELSRYAFLSRNPTWGEVGVLPFVYIGRVFVAGWVVWGVVKLDGRALLRVLLAAFGATFLLLYGWYFLILIEGGVFYLVVGDFLYLAGALLVACALLLAPGPGATTPERRPRSAPESLQVLVES